MEPIINQQMQTPTPKSKTWLWIVIIILVALLAGAGVYYWQNMEAKKMTTTAEEKVRSEMQIKITEAESKLTELQKNLNELKADIANTNESPNIVGATRLLGFSIKTPVDWTISQRSTENEIVFDMSTTTNETRESIRLINAEITLSDYKDQFLKRFSANSVLESKEIEIGSDKVAAWLIKTSEFGLEYIIAKYSGRIYVFTTQGAMLENGMLDTFNAIFTIRE